MARIARVVAPGFLHHVAPRGNRRQQTFFRDDDCEACMDIMAEWCGARRLRRDLRPGEKRAADPKREGIGSGNRHCVPDYDSDTDSDRDSDYDSDTDTDCDRDG